MNAKENALRIIHFDNPERIVQSPPGSVIYYFGCNHEGFEGGGHDLPVGSKWTDIWGTGWHKELDGCMAFPRQYPLANSSQLRTYTWPDPDDERLCSLIYRMANEVTREDGFLIGSHRDTLWEKSYMLVGMENMMVAFQEEPEFAREVLHRIMNFQMGIAKHYLNVGVEIVLFGDDLGTQMGPLVSPWIVEEFFMPEYRRLIELYKKHNVIISFHSCGKIEWAIPFFQDLGIDLLNPVQASANDLDKVRELTDGRIALQGGVSTKTIMEGPPERIVAEVRCRIWQLGRNGGYFCGPDQGLPFPPEHIAALNDAIRKYGEYPLRNCDTKH